MSYPPYNPSVSGKPSACQGQRGVSSGQAQWEPWKGLPHFGHGSRIDSLGAASASSVGAVSPQLSPPVSYRPEESGCTEDTLKSNIHIKEEVTFQPIGQGAHFTCTQRDEFPPSSRGMTSSLTSSDTQGHRPSDLDSGSNSLNRLPVYKKVPEDYPSKSNSESCNYGTKGIGQPVPLESSCMTDAPEQLADKIMKDFGLEKDDLNVLLSYPDDQTTAENLPFILHRIRLQKAKSTTASVQSVPHAESQITTSMSGMDGISGSTRTGMKRDNMPSTVFQQSKVNECGQSGKQTSGFKDKIEKTTDGIVNSVGSLLLMDTFSGSSHSREPLQGSAIVVQSGLLVSSHDKISSVAGVGSTKSSIAPPSSDQTKQVETQTNQSSKPIFTPFSLPKKKSDKTQIKVEVSEFLHSIDPVHESTSKTQPSITSVHGESSGQPSLFPMSSNDSCIDGQSNIQGHGSAAADQVEKRPIKQEVEQHPSLPVLQMWEALQSQSFLSAKPEPPTPSSCIVMDASSPVLDSLVAPCDPPPSVNPPSPPILGTAGIPQLPCPKRQSPVKKASSKGLPSAAMMHDYDGATPKVFSHTCSLCKKECTHMKDWISHLKTSLHADKRKHLREQYPEWDGDIPPLQSPPGENYKISPSTSAQNSQQRPLKPRRKSNSRSRSHSPPRRQSSDGRRGKYSYRPRVLHSPRRTCRSRSNSHSPRYDGPTPSRHRSRSRSNERLSSPWRRDRKRSWSRSPSPRHGPLTSSRHRSRSKSNERRSSPGRRGRKRSRSRSRSPRYDRRIHSRHRSRSRSNERRSSPGKRDGKRSSPRRSHSTSSSPRRRSRERSSSPRRRSRERVLSPRMRSCERVSSPRKRSCERVLSPRRRSRERVLSPRRRSRERVLSPRRRSRERVSSPSRRNCERPLSPNMSQDKPLSSKKSDVKTSSPKRRELPSSSRKWDVKRFAPSKSPERPSSPGNKHELPSSRVKNEENGASPRRGQKRRGSPEKSLSQQKKSSSVELLTKKLLTTTAVQSLTEKPSVEEIVKAVVSGTLAELAKLTSSSSSVLPSIMSKEEEESLSSPSSDGSSSSPDSSVLCTSNAAKMESSEVQPSREACSPTCSPTKPKLRKASAPTILKLKGDFDTICRSDVVDTMELFGKTKSVLFLKSKREAVVCFEREEDAEKLKSVKTLNVKGISTTVVTEEDDVSERPSSSCTTEQMVPPKQKSAGSSVFTVQTNTSCSTANPVVLPITTLISIPKQPRNTKLVTKSKVLVSKAKTVSNKQIVRCVKTCNVPAKGGVRSVFFKKEASRLSGTKKSKSPEKSPNPGDSNEKPTPEQSDTRAKECAMTPQDTTKVEKSSNMTITEPIESKEMVYEAKVSTSKAETTSATSKRETGVKTGVVTNENLEETTDCSNRKGGNQSDAEFLQIPSSERYPPNNKDKEIVAREINIPSKSTVPENQLDATDALKAKELEIKIQESTLKPVNTAEVDNTGNTRAPEMKEHTEPNTADVETKEVKETGPQMPGEINATQLLEVKSYFKGKEEKKEDAKGSPTKPKENTLSSEELLTCVLDGKVGNLGDTKGLPTKPKESPPPSITNVRISTKVREETMVDTKGSLSKPNMNPPLSSTAETTPDEPSADQPQKQQTVKASSQIHLNVTSHPESKPHGQEAEAKALPKQQTAAGRPVGATLEAKQAVKNVETTTNKMGTSAAVKTQESLTSKPASCVSAASTRVAASVAASVKTVPKTKKPAAKSKKWPAFAADTPLTVGERIETHLNLQKINCVLRETIMQSRLFALDSTLLLITNLPKYDSCCYTEADVVNLLCKFGFDYADDNIFIIPQKCTAFVLMPNVRTVQDIIRASLLHQVIFKQRELHLQVVKSDILMTPLGFYKSLMELMPFENPKDDGTSIVYIQNISPSEARDLRQALRKIGSLKNFLPLLNKVFIEFESIYDADRLGVWYSLLKMGHVHKVDRMKIPRSFRKSQPPRLPMKAMPDSMDIIPGAEMSTTKCGIPQGTSPPFWVTMTTIPYLFPTAAPWFNIPDFLTIRKTDYIKQVHHPGSKYSTIMLTGLPEGHYSLKDVAKLVWPYFPKQTLKSLYYNLLVLPLQRRAFVFFCNRDACSSFVQNHIRSPVCIRGCKLHIHFVLQEVHPGSSEEIMYRTLMKWSNAHAPELEHLEERLLCVEISETSVDLVKAVVKEVASIASFVNFLPLANRICIEMVGSRSVTQVVEEIRARTDLSTHKTWSKVGHIETLKSLKKRLQDSDEITINLAVETIATKAKPLTMTSGAQLPPSEPFDKGAQPASAKLAASTGSTISKLELKSEERAAEPPHIVLASKAEASTMKASQPTKENLAASAAGTTVTVDNTAANTTNMPSTFVTSGNQPEASETSKTEKLETKAQESAVVPKNTAMLAENRSETVPQEKQQTEPVGAASKGVKNAGSLELKNTVVGQTESSDGRQKLTDKAVPTKPSESCPMPSPKPPTASPKSHHTTIQLPNTSVKAASQVQKKMSTDPRPSSAQGPETKTDALLKQNQAGGSSAKAGLETKEMIREMPTKSQGEGPVTNVTNQKDSASQAVAKVPASAKTEPTAAVAVKKKQATAGSSSAADSSLTVGERIGSLLHKQSITCFSLKMIMSPKAFSFHIRLLLITNLPEYHDDNYTEADVAGLLHQFGFQYVDKNIFVIPQTCMAFVLMPCFESMQCAIKASRRDKLILNGSELCLQAATSRIVMSPFGFYKSLMELINFQVTDDGSSVIYINNISSSETRELKEALTKMDSVRNYLPLLNKAFVEFESIRDADRLGVWCSLLKRCPAYNIYRIKLPRSSTTALPPRLAAKALPDSTTMVAGVVAPTTKFGVPQGSIPPFSVTMTTPPFVFPTMSPWFIIPNFQTVNKMSTVQKTTSSQGPKFYTLMLTGLPEGNYTHKDVAKLVWQYLSTKSLHTLYYNIVVLPLQRRAFVYFSNWVSCCNFVRDNSKNPVSLKGSVLSVHQVLEEMNPGFSEEFMYRTMMKWSNAHVPELKSLEERLLCVEMSEISVHLIIMVMNAVLTIAAFVSFLPLANRICIVMAESSDVSKVLQNISRVSTPKEWSKVGRVESLKSLKQRLKASGEISINLEEDTTSITAKTPTVKSGAQLPPPVISNKETQPALQTSNPASTKPAASAGTSLSKSIKAEPKGITLSGVTMKETSEKVRSETTTDSTVAAKASGDKEKVELKEKVAEHSDIVPASKAETALNSQTSQPAGENSATAGTKENVEGNEANASSTSAILETQPNAAKTSSSKKVSEPAVVSKDTATFVETKTGTAPQVKQQVERVKADVETKEVKAAEPFEIKKAGEAEAKKAADSADQKGQKLTKSLQTKLSESDPPTSTAKTTTGTAQLSSAAPPQRPQNTLKTQKTSSQTQQNPTANAQSAAQELKTRTDTSEKHLQVSGSYAEAALPSKPKTKTEQKDPPEAQNTDGSNADSRDSSATTEVATSIRSEPNKKAAEGKDPPFASKSSAGSDPLTPGEKIGSYKLKFNLLPKKIKKSSKVYYSGAKLLLISNLPEYHDGCYTEVDFANVLEQHQVWCDDDEIIIIPQSRMAFIFSLHVKRMQEIFNALTKKNVIFKGSKLFVNIVADKTPKTLFDVYGHLMNLIGFKPENDGTNTVCIKNITPSEISNLRKILREIGDVTNFFPLLNKVIIEFQSPFDADRLGVWYSLLKQSLPHNILRMSFPISSIKSQAPKEPARAFPHSNDTVAGAAIPTSKSGIPDGTTPPFWVTMTTSPFIFPTTSPWFNIPAYRTINRKTSFTEASFKHFNFSTIMLTSLPHKTYVHEHVAKLVWSYFPEQNLYSLYSRVVVLPLQRRAFVYFSDWTACYRFVRDYMKNPVSVLGQTLEIHLVCENMDLGSSEEVMYTSLMKWSNSHVSDLEFLEERLLCMEVSGINMYLIMAVMKDVKGIASFVRFLPLANRIYVEMAEPSGVTKVLKWWNGREAGHWKIGNKIGRIESLKSRKCRLQGCEKIAVNLELGTIGVFTQHPATESKAQPPPAALSASVSAGPSTAVGADSAMKEKHGTEITVDSNSAAEMSEDVAELPLLDENSCNAIKAALYQYRLSKESTTKIPHQSNTNSGVSQQRNKQCRKDWVTARFFSDDVFDKQDFNFEDFVTIDEINEDAEERAVSRHAASHKMTSAKKAQLQRSGVSSATKPTTKSYKSSSPSSSSTSSISKSTKSKLDSTLDSVPTKMQKDSMDASKSQIKPSSSPGLKDDFQYERVQEVDKSRDGKREKDDSGKDTVGEEDNCINDQITDSFSDQPGEQMDKDENQESSSEIQRAEPEQGQRSQEGHHQIFDGVENKTKPCSETEIDTSLKAKDSLTEGQAAPIHKIKDEGAPVEPDQSTIKCKRENMEDSPKKQDRTVDEHATPTKDITGGNDKGTVSKAVDETIPKTSFTERSSRSRTVRETKGDKNASPDKVITDESSIMTRSTRGRRNTTTREDTENERKEMKTPTRMRSTPTRVSQRLNGKGATEKEDKAPLNESTSTAKITVPDIKEEEISQSDQEEGTTTRTRGRPRKRSRLTPVRKSPRGKKAESFDSQTPTGCVEKENVGRAAAKVIRKVKTEPEVPEAKHSRSQSPCVADNLKLPPFDPKVPLGQDFVVRKWGHFCNICSLAYLNESATVDLHCKTKAHYDNVQKYYQKCQKEPATVLM